MDFLSDVSMIHEKGFQMKLANKKIEALGLQQGLGGAQSN